MIILTSFTHLHVIPNLHGLFSSVEHKRRYFEKNISVFVHTMVTKLFGYQYSSKYLLLCSAEENKPCRFGMTQG